MAVLPGLSVGLTLSSAQFLAEVRRVNDSVNRLGQSVNAQNATLSRGAATLTGAVNVLKSAAIGLIGGLSVGALTQFGKAAVDTAGNLDEMAASAGVTAKQLQVLTFAGVKAGIGQQELATGLGMFARNVSIAAQGSNALASTFQRIGVDVRDANNNIRTSEDVLGDFAEAVKNTGSSQERLALLYQVLGRSGRQWINILSEGREGLARATAEAEAAGVILSGPLTGAADKASDAIGAMQYAIGKGFQIGVVEAFAGSVDDSTDALKEFVTIGKNLGATVGVAMSAIAKAAQFAADNFDLLRAAFAGFVAFRAATLFAELGVAVVSFATSVNAAAAAQGLLNAAMLANPAVIGAGAIAALVGALVYYRDTLIEVGDVSFTVDDAISGFGSRALTVLGGLATAVAQLLNSFVQLTTLDVSGAINAWRASGQGLIDVLKTVTFADVADEIGETLIRGLATAIVALEDFAPRVASTFAAMVVSAQQGIADLRSAFTWDNLTALAMAALDALPVSVQRITTEVVAIAQQGMVGLQAAFTWNNLTTQAMAALEMLPDFVQRIAASAVVNARHGMAGLQAAFTWDNLTAQVMSALEALPVVVQRVATDIVASAQQGMTGLQAAFTWDNLAVLAVSAIEALPVSVQRIVSEIVVSAQRGMAGMQAAFSWENFTTPAVAVLEALPVSVQRIMSSLAGMFDLQDMPDRMVAVFGTMRDGIVAAVDVLVTDVVGGFAILRDFIPTTVADAFSSIAAVARQLASALQAALDWDALTVRAGEALSALLNTAQSVFGALVASFDPSALHAALDWSGITTRAARSLAVLRDAVQDLFTSLASSFDITALREALTWDTLTARAIDSLSGWLVSVREIFAALAGSFDLTALQDALNWDAVTARAVESLSALPDAVQKIFASLAASADLGSALDTVSSVFDAIRNRVLDTVTSLVSDAVAGFAGLQDIPPRVAATFAEVADGAQRGLADLQTALDWDALTERAVEALSALPAEAQRIFASLAASFNPAALQAALDWDKLTAPALRALQELPGRVASTFNELAAGTQQGVAALEDMLNWEGLTARASATLVTLRDDVQKVFASLVTLFDRTAIQEALDWDALIARAVASLTALPDAVREVFASLTTSVDLTALRDALDWGSLTARAIDTLSALPGAVREIFAALALSADLHGALETVVTSFETLRSAVVQTITSLVSDAVTGFMGLQEIPARMATIFNEILAGAQRGIIELRDAFDWGSLTAQALESLLALPAAVQRMFTSLATSFDLSSMQNALDWDASIERALLSLQELPGRVAATFSEIATGAQRGLAALREALTWDSLVAQAAAALDVLPEVAQKVFSALSGLFDLQGVTDTVTSAFAAMRDGVAAAIDALVAEVGAGFADLRGIPATVAEAFAGIAAVAQQGIVALQNALDWDEITARAVEALRALPAAAQEIFASLATSFNLQGAIESVVATFDAMRSSVVETITGLVSDVGAGFLALQDIPGRVTAIFAGIAAGAQQGLAALSEALTWDNIAAQALAAIEALPAAVQQVFADLATAFSLPGVVESVAATFETMRAQVVATVNALIVEVRELFASGLQSAFDSVAAPVQQVIDLFQGMYDAVVGQSSVPDTMDGIGAQFGRLPAIMVAPTVAATTAVVNLFQSMKDAVEQARITKLLDPDLFADFAAPAADAEEILKNVADAARYTADGFVVMSESASNLQSALQTESEQLTRLRDAYLGVGESVEQVQRAIEIENRLMRAGVTIEEARATGLYDLVAAIVALGDETKTLAASSQQAADAAKAQDKALNDLTANLQTENDQLTRLSQAYAGIGPSVQEVTDQIAIENQLLAAGIPLHDERAAAITRQKQANLELARSIQRAEAQKATAQDISAQIQKQQLLLRYAGQETEEYRVQARLLDLKAKHDDAFAASQEANVRLAEQQATAIADAAESQEIFSEALKNAGTEIQRTFAQTFETIFQGGVTKFSELFSAIKDLAIRTAAEIAAAFVFRPEAVLSGLAGTAQRFGAFATVGTPAAAPVAAAPAAAQVVQTVTQAAPVVQTVTAPASAPLPVTAPEFTTFATVPSLFSRMTSAIDSFGADIGFATPATQPMLPGAQPGDIAGFKPAQPGTLVGTGATLSQTLGAGAIGVVGGSIVGGMFGGQGAAGGAVGGGLGAGVGYALGAAGSLGGPLGALIGGGLGTLIGGALGSMFGGGNQENQGSLRFQSTAGGAFDRGPFGGVLIQGENAFQAPLRKIISDFDARVAEFLTAYQEDLASAAVQALEQFDKREPEADPSRGFAEILRERAEAILTAAYSDLDFSGIFEGATGVEEVADRVEQVLETIQTYGELIGTTSPAIQAAGSQLSDLKAGFDEVRDGARELGISIEELNAAEQDAIAQLREDVGRQVSDLIDFGFLTTGAQEIRAEIEALEEQFDVARAAAKELGLSVRGLAAAEEDAIEAVRQRVQANVSNLIQFGTTDTAGARLQAQIDELAVTFANAAAEAEELGISTEGLAAAQQRAEAQLREAAQSTIDAFVAGGQGSDNRAVLEYNQALDDLNAQFSQAISLARQLDLPLEKIREIIRAGNRQIGGVRAETIEGLQDLATAAEQGGVTGPGAEFRREQENIRQEFRDAIQLAKELNKPTLTARLQAGRDLALQANREQTLAGINDLIAAAGQIDTGIVGQFRSELERIEIEFGAAREILREMNISRVELNAAEERAIAALREQTREQINALVASAAGPGSAEGAGAAFRAELQRIQAAFDEARQIASELGFSIAELNAAETRAVENLRENARQQIDDVLAMANVTSGAGAQFRAELDRIRDAFTEARALASALGLSIDELNEAQGRAVANLRANARAQIEATIASGTRTTGPGQAFLDEIRQIEQAFDDARELATELGESLDALNAAEVQALTTARERAALQIQELLTTGELNGAGAHYAQELARIRAEFADGRALARALGMDVEALNDAQGRAISSLKDEVRARAALLNQDTSEAVIQFREDLAALNNEFAEVIAGAEALGIVIGDLSAAQEQAAERLRQTALETAENQALAASRQFDQILLPLRELEAELRFAVASPVEQFRLARQEFERIAELARSGDLSAIAALPDVGRLFLEQATQFGASPGRVEAEEQIQQVLRDVIAATEQAQRDATRGVEEEIRRASEREIDKLDELINATREQVREFQRMRDAITQSRTA